MLSPAARLPSSVLLPDNPLLALHRLGLSAWARRAEGVGARAPRGLSADLARGRLCTCEAQEEGGGLTTHASAVRPTAPLPKLLASCPSSSRLESRSEIFSLVRGRQKHAFARRSSRRVRRRRASVPPSATVEALLAGEIRSR
jgi:hypothetical protein